MLRAKLYTQSIRRGCLDVVYNNAVLFPNLGNVLANDRHKFDVAAG